MKKILVLFVLVTLITGVVFAEEEDYFKHWISGEVSLFGLGVRYEYMLNENLSVGANVYFNSFLFLWNELGFDASVRFYPGGNIFFLGMGLGYHGHTGTFKYKYEPHPGYEATGTWFGTINGFAITPEVGWKIDVAGEGGFFLQPGMKLPVTLGTLKMYGTNINEFRVGVGFVMYLGLGYTF